MNEEKLKELGFKLVREFKLPTFRNEVCRTFRKSNVDIELTYGDDGKLIGNSLIIKNIELKQLDKFLNKTEKREPMPDWLADEI